MKDFSFFNKTYLHIIILKKKLKKYFYKTIINFLYFIYTKNIYK